MDMQAKRLFNRKLWRWYFILVIANLLDLAFTYFGLSHGIFSEANPLVRSHLFTLWPVAVKIGGLGLLALGIGAVLQSTLRRQRFVLRAVRLTTGVYAAVIVLHVLYLLTVIAAV